MNALFKKVLILCLLFMPVWVSAAEISRAFMPEHENGEVIYFDKKTSERRSASSFFTERILRDNRVIYKYTANGKGDYDEYEDVTFDMEAEMEERDGFLYPIYSSNSIKDKNGDLIVKHEKTFDYSGRRIQYIILDTGGDIIKKAVFPIKGKTVDGPTLIHFLKTFAAHRNEKEYRAFYLISDRAHLYRVNVRDMGVETLELAGGKIEAIKLRLIPDLGLLTGIAKSMVPPTFIWFTAQEPYDWLQYEGLETDIGSTHVLIRKSKKMK
ncbi:MAG: hypothetical protein WC312_02145 [Candidatus Omnitrophota bacterium]